MIHGYRVLNRPVSNTASMASSARSPMPAKRDWYIRATRAGVSFRSLAIGVFAQGLNDAGYGLPYLALLDRDSS